MGVGYKAVLWNKNKRKYDLILWGSILGFIGCYIVSTLLIHPNVTIETLIIRSTALVAFLLLHVILIIGPLCRIDNRFLPLLYNRRHLGVSMFLVAAIHGIFCIIQFHSLGDTNALESVFTSNQNYQSISQFPFQILGFTALVIFLLMAATSHDFWLKNLSPRFWKYLHMFVYVAYVLILFHVLLGTLQYEQNPLLFAIVLGGFVLVSGLHTYAGWKEYRSLSYRDKLQNDGFFKVGTVDEIENNKGKTVCIEGQNIAIFKYDQKLSAVSNVCRHQLGPLGEGKVIDGCITCPWHGYQYRPEDGQSPPPFEEKIETYQVKLEGDEIWVHPKPMLPGTFVTPCSIN